MNSVEILNVVKKNSSVHGMSDADLEKNTFVKPIDTLTYQIFEYVYSQWH